MNMICKNKLTPEFLIVPYVLVLDEKLTNSDRLVFSVVYYLSNMKEKSCFASNTILADLANLSGAAISKSLKKLENGGYIIRTYHDPETKHQRKEIIMLLDKKGKKKKQPKGYTGGGTLNTLGVIQEEVGRHTVVRRGVIPEEVLKNTPPIDDKSLIISQKEEKKEVLGVIPQYDRDKNRDRKNRNRKIYLVPSGPSTGEKKIKKEKPINILDKDIGSINGCTPLLTKRDKRVLVPEAEEDEEIEGIENFEGKEINKVISLFTKLFPGDFIGKSPAYAKPPIREAVEELMASHTIEEIEELIDKYTKGESDPYRPGVGTIYEFCTFKLAKVEAYTKKTSGMFYNRPLGGKKGQEGQAIQRKQFFKDLEKKQADIIAKAKKDYEEKHKT